jgi:hypothetical protein
MTLALEELNSTVLRSRWIRCSGLVETVGIRR